MLAGGGVFLFSVWDGVETNDVARVVSEALAALFPQDPPTFMQRVPHGHGDCAAVERDLRKSGFTRIAWESVDQRSRADSARGARGVCGGTPIRHEILARDARALGKAVETATRAFQREYGDGAIRAFVFTAASCSGGPVVL